MSERHIHPSDLLIDFSIPVAQTISIQPEQVAEDIRFLTYALEYAYPAKWVMPEVSWRRVIQHLLEFRPVAEIHVNEFGDFLSDVLWEIPDGHLKVKNGNITLGHQFRAHLRSPSTGVNIASEADVWKIEFRESDVGRIPIIGIAWFPQASQSHWDGFIDRCRSLLNAPAIIVDLRGNGGGDDTMAIELTSLLIDKELPLGWVREKICESAEAYSLQANTYSSILWNQYERANLVPPPELVAFRDSILAQMEEHSCNPQPSTMRVVQSSLPSTFELGERAYQGDIYVLIDGNTVSSGEWTALYLQHHPNTKLIGENTYGMIHFGNSGKLRLPNSRLDVTLCMKINELIDGRFFEKTGIPPDVRVTDQEALKAVLDDQLG